MVNGRLVCLGSNQHLKTKFGDGYRLVVNHTKGSVEDIIRQRFARSQRLPENTYGVSIFKLPGQGFSFYQLFSFLQMELKNKGIIDDFSISQSSLENVFLYFSKFQYNMQNE